MQTRVIIRKTSELTPKEYKACYSLNFRSAGLMRGKLYYGYNFPVDNEYTFMIWNASKTKLIAWALSFPMENRNKQMVYFYTRAKYRRQGYGKALAKVVKKHVKRRVVDAHDEQAQMFFKSVKMKDYLH